MTRCREWKKAPLRACRSRRRFLAWNAFALLGALSLRWGARLLPEVKPPLQGREARWYRKVR